MARDTFRSGNGVLLVTAVLGLGVAVLLPPAVSLAAETKAGPDTEYRINAGDELDVFVWGEQQMQRTVRVLPDGTFAFPLAGTIAAANRTASELSAELRERLARNYRDAPPDVTVAVRATAGMSFYVIGKVRTPGGYTSVRPINVLQALSMAGGLADFANVKKAVILRQTPGGQVVEHLHIADILKGGRNLESGDLAGALPLLKGGDVLVVP
ncbi:polysaccharide biosynthesis/export family protein [Hephaestia sp. GCM10023244]|uniref:polysaccharide biosynthesis/export family protein n=1 Tax=unclassified Hephaestia TaxID=2631281 RepID=UPI0020770314|nr:polysaccharide biosynthesis/export family protein [Hephaestia sp. MAHUQ-44]MCM8729769.1 polysaccharide biosynthesis/export family protein [Hephaestia sp. MAHUQ-44]